MKEMILEISPLDDMYQGNLEHYINVCNSALTCIDIGLADANLNPQDINRILDFPCGFGRVLRGLRSKFSDADITACDLNYDAVDFCAKTFNAIPVYSSKVFSEINFKEKYDLIWVGSLFTHLEFTKWKEFLNLFEDLLNPGGLLFISLHGEKVYEKIKIGNDNYGLPDNLLESLCDQYQKQKFAYVNYPGQEDYGISICSKSNSLFLLKDYTKLSLLFYNETAWDHHHDILCCRKVNNISVQKINNSFDMREFLIQPNKPILKTFSKDFSVIFSLPEGLTLGGVTTWSIELSRELNNAGFKTFLGIHPSKYNNPPLDFGISSDDNLIDCTHLKHPDDPKLNADDYIPLYNNALPGILIPSWSWGTYKMASIFASKRPDLIRIIGMAHSDESGYYQWLVHYEEMIHKFIVANSVIHQKLSLMLPHRVKDIYIKPCPVKVPKEIIRTYSPNGTPLKLVYGGRIAQYQKRVFDLIELAHELINNNVNFQLRVIGGGSDREEFYKKVNFLPKKIRELIILEDSVPLAELPEIWRTSDINILVSEFEGVSNSMLMGMAHGCVSVMTEVSGTSEVIESGENGYLIPVGNMHEMALAIKNLDTDRSLLEKFGQNAYKKIKSSYSISDYKSWFITMIENVISESPRPWPPIKTPLPFEQIHQEVLKLEKLFLQNKEQPHSQNKTNILFLSHDSNWGGAPKVLFSLVKGLDKNLWNPIIALPKHGKLESEFEKIGIKTLITPMQYITTDSKNYWEQYEYFSNNLNERVQKVRKIISDFNIELVVSNTICIFEGALAAKLSNIPHIWYVHEISSQDNQLTPLLDYESFYSSIDIFSDKVVTISKTCQKEFSKFYPSKKLELVYTGLEENKSDIEANKEKILGIPSDSPAITFIGVISERKGVFELVESAYWVSKKFPKVKFVIAGNLEGPTYTNLVSLIKLRKLEHHFKFLGFRNDVESVISSSDIIVVPSRIEPFSLVTLESMENKKPVVSTRSGGPEEIIIDGETGFLVSVKKPYELAQALIHLLENPGLIQEMGNKGYRHYTENFNYQKYIDRFNKLISDVVSQNKSKDLDNQEKVNNFIKLVSVAANTKRLLADINFKNNPINNVVELIDYPGYIPHEIIENNPSDERPLVSVCVPVYNGAQYLQDCISSILSQTFSNFELILVNDFSTDESHQIIESFSDPRIKYFENKINLGLIQNWNKCIDLAKGEYVCIFHQDDVMSPFNLEEKAKILRRDKELGFVYSDCTVIDQNGTKTSDHWFNLIEPNIDFLRPGNSFFDLMFNNLNIVCCPSVLVRRECYEKLGGFDIRLPFSADMEMWMRISLFYDVAYIAQPLINYRYHQKNTTHKYLELDLIHIYLCKKMVIEKYPKLLDNSKFSELIKNTSQRVFDRAIHHYFQHQYRTAKQYLVFLELIRSKAIDTEYIDFLIKQLDLYLNQTNTIDWIKKSRNFEISTSERKEINYFSDLLISSENSDMLHKIKPYVPKFIKSVYRKIQTSLSDQT